jgi:hypothetical protein
MHILHAACAAGAPRSCLRKRLRTACAQRDVAYARVGIGLLMRELTRSLRVSKRCLRTQRKRYETLGTYYNTVALDLLSGSWPILFVLQTCVNRLHRVCAMTRARLARNLHDRARHSAARKGPPGSSERHVNIATGELTNVATCQSRIHWIDKYSHNNPARPASTILLNSD